MSKNKTIFLDRDGVINKDPGGWTPHSYVTKLEEFIIFPYAEKAIKKLNDAGFDIVIISNQAGVSKGHYTKEALDEVNKFMIDKLEKNGGKIKATFYCVHQNSDNCDCRKPRTGLFKKAEEKLGIEAKGSFFVGDGKTDVEAADTAGLKSVLVLSGKTDVKDVKDWSVKPDYIFDDLLEAVEFIEKGDR